MPPLVIRSVEIAGLGALVAKLRQADERVRDEVRGVLSREAERIMTNAKLRTPVRTGALRASGQVAAPEASGTSVTVEMGFGSAAVRYAIFVHENLRARHAVGEAKFLERAVDEARATLERRIADEIRAIFPRVIR